ncbi:hypothetical protein AB0L47_27485 [Streptomyces bobili]|uniref:hypothetical protein n=1 Tax=Streptomyces bobili TaxID=67280 RepID=UPI00343AF658
MWNGSSRRPTSIPAGSSPRGSRSPRPRRPVIRYPGSHGTGCTATGSPQQPSLSLRASTNPRFAPHALGHSRAPFLGRKTDDRIAHVHRDLYRHRRKPLLHGHVVYARGLMPGVGYVDLVLQVLARQGHPMPEVELRNLTILAPLVAGPGEAVLTTVEGRPAAGGGQRIEVRSRRAQDTDDALHAVVTADHRGAVAFTERLPLPVQGVTRSTTMDEIYTWCREYDLFHSGLMKLGGVVHHRPGDWIAELELASEHQDSTGAFFFHPALFEARLLGGGVALGMLHGTTTAPASTSR